MDEEKAEMADADEVAAEDPGCAFAVSGMAKHTYRTWHSWDLTGSVNMGEAASSFAIVGAAPARELGTAENLTGSVNMGEAVQLCNRSDACSRDDRD